GVADGWHPLADRHRGWTSTNGGRSLSRPPLKPCARPERRFQLSYRGRGSEMIQSRIREVDYLHDREPPDHFVRRDGIEYAGTHLILDLWNAQRLDELETVEAALRKAASDAGATLLNIDLHRFTPNGGISGVA